jgi:hypothetical protein
MVIKRIILSLFFICYTNLSFSSHIAAQKYSIFVNLFKEQLNKENIVLQESSFSSGDENICKHFFEKSLKAITASKSSDYKKRYRDFIDNFRKAINTRFYQEQSAKTSSPSLVNNIQKTSFIFFTKIEMDDFHNSLTKHVAFKGKISSLLSPRIKHPMSKSIDGKIEILKQQTAYLGKIWEALRQGKKVFNLTAIKRVYSSYLGGTTWSKLDIQRFEGLPRIKLKAKTKLSRKPLTFVRMSTPTIGSNETTVINPEFKAYLAYLSSQNLTHSYINLQDNRHTDEINELSALQMIKSLGINYEYHRSAKIEQLRDKSLRAVTLSKDNVFYFQKSQFSKLNNINNFIESYLNNFLQNKENGYYLSAKVKDNLFEEDLHRSFFLLKDILFGKRSISSARERTMFIELSYFFIIDSLSKKTDFINITCKDGIDRAGATHTLLFITTLLREIILEQITTKDLYQQLEKLPEVLFADALSIKKREVIRQRLEITIPAILWFLNKVQNNLEISKFLLEKNNIESFR